MTSPWVVLAAFGAGIVFAASAPIAIVLMVDWLAGRGSEAEVNRLRAALRDRDELLEAAQAELVRLRGTVYDRREEDGF